MGRLTLAKDAYIQGVQHLPKVKDRLGLILGTGWSEEHVLERQGFVLEDIVSFSQVGILVGQGAGHPNRFLFGTWHGRDVVISQGRVHLYQDLTLRGSSMLREWMYVFLKQLGRGSQVIITSSVGGLSVPMRMGTVVMPEHLVSAHLPQPYLRGNHGEFVMSEHLLWQYHKEAGIDRSHHEDIFFSAALAAGLDAENNAVHMVVPGPGFGGAFERTLWKGWGCDTVGMSLDPELRLIALENADRELESGCSLPQIEVFASFIVTDDHDLPNHVEISAAARSRAPQLGKFLSCVVDRWNVEKESAHHPRLAAG